MSDGVLIPKQLPGKSAVENCHRLRCLLVSFVKVPALQYWNTQSAEITHSHMILFPMHLFFGDFRMARDMDGRVPDTSRNGTHRERRIFHGGQRFQLRNQPVVKSM